MSRVKPAQVHFYVDADIRRLGMILGALRPDVTYPGDPGAVIFKKDRPPCVISSVDTKDPVWIPEVTRQGWLILTRDRHIQDHLAEISAVREHGARMVVLAGKEARNTFDQLEIVMCQWRSILGCLSLPGPFIYTATRATFKSVDLG